MKKRKISLIIIALAMAFCMALCVILPACSGGGDGEKDNSSEHTHTYDVLKYDDENHWYECSCGEASPDDPVAHSSENEYKYDDDSHWLVCDVCGQKFGTEAHDVTSGTCVCGYVPEVHTHVYDVLKSDETGHWYECACGEGGTSGFAAHDSTAYDSDENQHWTICSVCNFVTGTTENHSSEGDEWKYDNTYHWHECVCGAQLDKTEHTLTDGKCSCGYEKADLTSTTIYMVGDSTMCSFTDTYYLPRYGYGTQLANYLTDDTDAEGKTLVTVQNLAMSGRSSLSFLSETNYTTLKNSIGEGDYLIIGFGHNDEKVEDSSLYTDPSIALGTDTDGEAAGFKDNLNNNYIQLAKSAGATPILCTPIVRYSDTSNYSGSKAHVTTEGDYPQAIIDLGTATNTTVIDLTAITKANYLTDNDAAQWYHSHTTVEAIEEADATTNPMARKIETTDSHHADPSDETDVDDLKYQWVIPAGRDDTHLNMYGAKMVAYEFVEALSASGNSLADYIAEGNTKPTMEADFEEAYNQDYLYKAYSAFNPETDTSKVFTSANLPDGWYATAFGNVGSVTTSRYTIKYDNGTFTIGSLDASNGKIESGDDGIAAAFMQIDRYEDFTVSATMKVTADLQSSSSLDQIGFGMMLRDDIYIDVGNDSTINSNYVTAGVLGKKNSTSYANFYRLDGSIVTEKTLPSVYAVGDVYELEMIRVNQVITCKITPQNGTTISDERTDISYYGIDANYIYLCLFATRGVTCEFSNVTYTKTGTNTGA